MIDKDKLKSAINEQIIKIQQLSLALDDRSKLGTTAQAIKQESEWLCSLLLALIDK